MPNPSTLSRAAAPHVDVLSEHLAVVRERVRDLARQRREREHPGGQPLRGLVVATDAVDRILNNGHAPPPPDVAPVRTPPEGSRLARLAGLFDLDDTDVALLIAALAPDVDPDMEGLYTYLNDDVMARYATVDLALRIVGLSALGSDRDRLRAGGALVDGGLIEVDDDARPFPGRSLRVPDRVTSHLLGDDRPDPDTARLLARVAPGLGGGIEPLARVISRGVGLAYVRETPGSSGRGLAKEACNSLGLDVLTVDLDRLRPQDDPWVVARRLLLEARLAGAVLVAGPIERYLAVDATALTALAELDWPTILVGSSAWNPSWAQRVPYLVVARAPDAAKQAEAWSTLLGDDVTEDVDFADMARTIRLSAEQIDRAATAAWYEATARDDSIRADDVRAAALEQSGTSLERRARRIEPRATFEDIVLSTRARQSLRVLLDRARWGERVYGDWGMARLSASGGGLTALFTGPPGTGKTMAAEVLAHELLVDLYVIDLSTVLDKYVGETEKNLDRIFSEAENVNGVLLFDEADALFGKRSGVSSANDRYANVEVAYLLQRMERFDGVAILTTNLRQNIDEAFLRRLDAVVEFPEPNAEQRLAIWQRFLGGALPVEGELDLAFCAENFQLAGGHIRNVVLRAAFAAAAEDRPVRMRDLVVAVVAEYETLGRLCHESDFGPYYEFVSDLRPESRPLMGL